LTLASLPTAANARSLRVGEISAVGKPRMMKSGPGGWREFTMTYVRTLVELPSDERSTMSAPRQATNQAAASIEASRIVDSKRPETLSRLGRRPPPLCQKILKRRRKFVAKLDIIAYAARCLALILRFTISSYVTATPWIPQGTKLRSVVTFSSQNSRGT
jgi:hypothetical protein